MKKMILLICAIFLSISGFASERFQGLGAGSIANDISADGSVVVGSGRWTQSTGWQDIGCTANACSADGSVVVGYRQNFSSSGSGYKTSLYWTGTGGSIELTGKPTESAIATDVSDDGTKVTGYLYSSGGTIINPYTEAFIYKIGVGQTRLGDIPAPPGEENLTVRSAAYAISGDGSIVAGYGSPPHGNIYQSMYWTETTGMVNMGALKSSDWYSCITGVSQDGSKMIGQSGWFFSAGSAAIRWSEESGMEALGQIDGFSFGSCPLGFTDDLSTIVGWATDESGNYTAFLWGNSLGMVNLQEYLQTVYSFNLNNWTLTEATGISADGLTIVGNGINPEGVEEAWMATIPEPATLMLLSLGGLAFRRRR